MINHFLVSLYNRTDVNPDGVYNPLKEPLVVPATIRGYFDRLRGNSVESAWNAAKMGVKVVSASTWGSYLSVFDSRLTTDYDLLTADIDANAFIDSVNEAKGNVILALTEETPLIKKGLFRDVLPMERAAAILVGVVGLISAVNTQAVRVA